MNSHEFFLFLLLVCAFPTLFLCQKQQQKKYQQDVKKKPSKSSKSTSSEQKKDAAFFNDFLDKVNTIVPESNQDFTTEVRKDGTSQFSETSSQLSCPKCAVSSNHLKYSLQQFWLHNIDGAFACACEAYVSDRSNPSDLLRALMTSLKLAKMQQYPTIFNLKSLTIVADPKPALREWEVLGPFPVGKMEIDGDPAFQSETFSEAVDMASYLLSMASTSSRYSELVSEGKVTWKKVSSGHNGQVRMFLFFNVLPFLFFID
jgi:hypothetical protein